MRAAFIDIHTRFVCYIDHRRICDHRCVDKLITPMAVACVSTRCNMYASCMVGTVILLAPAWVNLFFAIIPVPSCSTSAMVRLDQIDARTVVDAWAASTFIHVVLTIQAIKSWRTETAIVPSTNRCIGCRIETDSSICTWATNTLVQIQIARSSCTDCANVHEVRYICVIAHPIAKTVRTGA